MSDHQPAAVSVCMIVRDEERFLPQCLQSIRPLADELVVLDTGSTDRTVEISTSFGARVYSFDWSDDYAEARNKCLEYATGDWILVLDADEQLQAPSAQMVRAAIERRDVDAYELLFYNHRDPEPVEGPDIIHRVCRLFRNRPEYRYVGRVHERIAPSIAAAGGVIAELDAVVDHFGYRPEVKDARRKRERYLKLLHEELAASPGDPYVLHHLAAAHCADGDFTEALPLLERESTLISSSSSLAGQAFSRLANAYCALNRPQDALVTAQTAEDRGIAHPEIFFTQGRALLEMGRYPEAVNAFEQAIELGKTRCWTGDPSTFGYEARHGIACAYFALGDYARAAEQAQLVLKGKPDHPQARLMMEEANSRLVAKQAKRPRISLCMIVRDEEAFISECLESAAEIVDEIVVVDTGSTDRTPEIARVHGAKVHSYQWNDNYSDARNASIDLATGDWILILDADERLDGDSAAKLRWAAEHVDADAFQLLQRSYLQDGPDSNIVQCATCRLFRNRPEYRYRGAVHEHVLYSINEAGGTVRYLDAIIHHRGYQPDVIERQGKHERYVRLIGRVLENEPDNAYYLHTLAAAHLAAREYDQALPLLKRAAELVGPSDEFAAQVFCELTTALYMTGEPEAAIQVADHALATGLSHPGLHFNKGNALMLLQRHKDAVPEYERALEVGASGVWNGDAGTYGYKAEFALAAAHAGLEDYGSAAKWAELTLRSRPAHPEAHRLLAQAYTNVGRMHAAGGCALQAIEVFSKAITADPACPEPYFNAGDVLYSLGRYEEAADLYTAGLAQDASHAPGFFALGNCCFRLGAYEAAAQAYRQALAIDPQHREAISNLGLALQQMDPRAA